MEKSRGVQIKSKIDMSGITFLYSTAWSSNSKFCLATVPPSLELPDGCIGCNRFRWGWGGGCWGRGRSSWGKGVRECREGELGISAHSSEGFLTTHRSHCSKLFISATALQPPPLELSIH